MGSAMVRIRFRRVGAKNQPSFRIVAADKESPRDGRFLEVLGSYNPRTEPSTLQVDEARLFHWMKNGAQPSEAVVQTLSSVGTWERWERFKQGESLETLLSEAEAALPEADPRTRRDDRTGKRSKKRRASKMAKAPEPDAELGDEPAEAEAEESGEAEAAKAEAAASAEAETEESDEAEAAEAEAEESGEAEAAEAAAETTAEAEAAESDEPESTESVAPSESEAEESNADAEASEADEGD